MLLDTGAADNMMSDELVPEANKTKPNSKAWTAAHGAFNTECKTSAKFRLPEFSVSKDAILDYNMLKSGNLLLRNMIIGGKGPKDCNPPCAARKVLQNGAKHKLSSNQSKMFLVAIKAIIRTLVLLHFTMILNQLKSKKQLKEQKGF